MKGSIKTMNQYEQLIFDANERTHILNRNQFTLELAELDHTVISTTVRQDNTNIYGIVHGGTMLMLADVSAGLTALTDGRRYVTQNTSCQFLSNTNSGSIHCHGRVLHRSKNTASVRVEIFDDNEKLLFESLFTMFVVTDRKLVPVIQSDNSES